MTVKNYSIETGNQNTHTHTFRNLTEELCKAMCDITDNGERYSNSSRYNYSCNGVDTHKGIKFGTAKAAVQFAIMDHFGENVTYLKIQEAGTKSINQ